MPEASKFKVQIANIKVQRQRLSGRQTAAGSYRGDFEFSQVPGVVQTGNDLLAFDVGKLSDDVLDAFALGEIAENQADWNPGPANPGLAPENVRGTHNLLTPGVSHASFLSDLIVRRLRSGVKQDLSPEIRNRNTQDTKNTRKRLRSERFGDGLPGVRNDPSIG